MPTLLKNCLTLNSISSSVLQKYNDRPEILINHLPFAEITSNNKLGKIVHHENNG